MSLGSKPSSGGAAAAAGRAPPAGTPVGKSGATPGDFWVVVVVVVPFVLADVVVVITPVVELFALVLSVAVAVCEVELVGSPAEKLRPKAFKLRWSIV